MGLGERVVGHLGLADGGENELGAKEGCGGMKREDGEVLSSCQSTGWIKPRTTRRAFNFFAALRGAHNELASNE